MDLRTKLLRVLATAATVACLPILFSGSGVAAENFVPRRSRPLRRRALRQWRGRNRSRGSHYSLLDPSDYVGLLGDDIQWASSNIPLLDFDDAVQGGASMVRAYYFRWRVFRKHLRKMSSVSDHGGSSGGGGDGVLCCEGSAAECAVVNAATGWCSGANSASDCHRRRTETRPCVWNGRCAKGSSFGSTGQGASCPAPRPSITILSAAAAAVTAVAPKWVVTEFEPDVPWAGAYNTIACSAGHHLMEGRWLREAAYLDDYSRFWFAGSGEPRKYTFWAASAMLSRYRVTGDVNLLTELYAVLAANYQAWVDAHYSREFGCFWQYADRDGQEHSVGGDGCRPLLNSMMRSEAAALATIAGFAGDDRAARRYRQDALRWQAGLLALWAPSLSFFVTRSIPRPSSALHVPWTEKQRLTSQALNGGKCPREWSAGQLVTSRELQGLSSPWYFSAIPYHNASHYAPSWRPLFDRAGGFAAQFGPRTAERSDPCVRALVSILRQSWAVPPPPALLPLALCAVHASLDLTNAYPTRTVTRLRLVRLPSTTTRRRMNARGMRRAGRLRRARPSAAPSTSCTTIRARRIRRQVLLMRRGCGLCLCSMRGHIPTLTPSTAAHGCSLGLGRRGWVSLFTLTKAIGWPGQRCTRPAVRIAIAAIDICTAPSAIWSLGCLA